jgi:hypothetical protein
VIPGSATDAPDRKTHLAHAAGHVLFGAEGRVASTVYGTVLIMATLAAAYATEKHPWKLALVVFSTAFVLWIAHLYAHGLAESLAERRRLRRDELVAIVRRELGIMLAAVVPVAALIAGALGVVAETTGVWLALSAGLLTLGVDGLRFARYERLGRAGTFAAVGANLGLGLTVVALKVAVMH